jgi:hypothetical protein
MSSFSTPFGLSVSSEYNILDEQDGRRKVQICLRSIHDSLTTQRGIYDDSSFTDFGRLNNSKYKGLNKRMLNFPHSFKHTNVSHLHNYTCRLFLALEKKSPHFLPRCCMREKMLRRADRKKASLTFYNSVSQS